MIQWIRRFFYRRWLDKMAHKYGVGDQYRQAVRAQRETSFLPL